MSVDLVTFNIDDKEYAVTLVQVREVIRMREIISVPEAAVFVAGVINLRGRVVPIINLRRKIGLAAGKTPKPRIIVSQVVDHVVGIIVDTVSDVITIETARITPPDKVLSDAAYLQGVARIGKRLILLVDLPSLFSEQEQDKIRDVHGRVEIRKRGS